MASPNGISRLTAQMPGMGRPAASRWFAYLFIVRTSWVSRIRFSLAAHSRMTQSGARDNPASYTRTMSSSGFRRFNPRKMSLSKFWSAAKRIIRSRLLISLTGEQAFPDADQVEARLILSTYLLL